MTIKQSRIIAKKALELNKQAHFLKDGLTVSVLAPAIRQAPNKFADLAFKVATSAIFSDYFDAAQELSELADHPDRCTYFE